MNTESTESTAVTDEGESTIDEGSLRTTARRGAFALALVLAGLMTVLFLLELFSLLVFGWTADTAAELGIHRLHVMSIATVVAVFVVGLLVQAYRPRERVASLWGAFLVILVASAGTVAYGVGRPEEVLPFLVLTGIALVAHPAGRAVLRRGASFSPTLLALVVVAAVPLLAFAANQYALSGNAADPHAADGHYVMMAALAVAPLAYGFVAALGFAGWRLAAWLAALPMAYYGLMAVSFLDQTGSVGTMWGAAAIVWAVAFVAVAEYSRVSTATAFRREVARPN